MLRIRYRITTLSPALFVMNVGDTNMVATRDYIPGSVIMGLFAGEFIREKSRGDKAQENYDFYQWFLRGDVRFTNAFIVSQDERGQFQKCFPVPLSIQHEKSNEETISDLLFSDKHDGHTVKQPVYKAGFSRTEGDILYRQPVKKSLNFHHQRDPKTGTAKTGTAKKGLIFNYESLDANQTFEGNILGSCEALQAILTLFPSAQTTYIGRSRNAQYGKIRFEFVSRAPEEFVSETDGFTSKTLEKAIENNEVSLTLLSNTIIYHDNGLSTTEVTGIERLLKKEVDAKVVVKKAFIKTDEVENFVSVWRLRKPSEVCFKTGSCFLLSGISQEHTEKLLGLQRNGIGERRGEGFGRIVFGCQSKDRGTFKLRKTENKKLEKPSGAIPHQTSEIVRTIVSDFIRRNVELSALRDATMFVREDRTDMGLPSKSLIGRLEAMVKTSDKNTFRAVLEKDLRKTARDKLEGCKDRKGSQTLFEFLKNGGSEKITVAEIFRQGDMTEVKALCDAIGFHPEDDRTFEEVRYRNYFLAFFSEMRRIIKQGK